MKVFCTGKFLVFILYNGKGGGRKDPFIANICIFAVLDDSQYLDLNNVRVIVTNERWPDKLVLDGACQC